jgi:hypothetical protein
MTPKSANGVRGHLLYIHGDNKYVFRVYDAEHNFVDYDLLHCDLCVTIDDEDAYFYRDEWKDVLDHSPATLGHKDDTP